jgi:hypothetical protein
MLDEVPDYLGVVPGWSVLWMLHIDKETRTDILEELRKRCIDDGDHEFAADGYWDPAVAYQNTLDVLRVTAPGQYELEKDAMLKREIQWFISDAVLAHLTTQQGYIKTCYEIAEDVLERYHVREDPWWQEQIECYRQYDSEIMEEVFNAPDTE